MVRWSCNMGSSSGGQGQLPRALVLPPSSPAAPSNLHINSSALNVYSHVRPFFPPSFTPSHRWKTLAPPMSCNNIHVDAISIHLKIVRLAVFFVVQYALIPRHKQTTSSFRPICYGLWNKCPTLWGRLSERGLLLRKIVLYFDLQIAYFHKLWEGIKFVCSQRF